MNETYIFQDIEDIRHGGPWDRGNADRFYHREYNPHYFVGKPYQSVRVKEHEMTIEELAAYHRGFTAELL